MQVVDIMPIGHYRILRYSREYIFYHTSSLFLEPYIF